MIAGSRVNGFFLRIFGAHRASAAARAAATAMAVALALAACEKPADRAKRQLEANNIAFSVDDFVDAAGRADAETVRLFIEAGIETGAMDANGYTALMRAAEQGNIEVVQMLIGAGTNLDAQGVEGATALMQAAYFNRIEVVRALIDAGADARLVDVKGWSALMKALYRKHDRIVEAMLPHCLDEAPQALILATVTGQPRMVEILLAGGASPDTAIDKGQTALMIAARRNDEETARALLGGGAQPLLADSDGKTASMIAAENGHRNLARLLQNAEAGKKIPPPPPVAVEKMPEEPSVSGSVATTASAPPPDVPSLPPRQTAAPEGPIVSAAAPETPLPPPTAGPGDTETLLSGLPPATKSPQAFPQMKLISFNGSRVPLTLTAVQNGVGQFRDESGADLYARQGDPIGDGRFIVVSLRQRRIIDKDGSPVDASEARVKDASSGREHRLVKDLPARASRDSAVLAVNDRAGGTSRLTVNVGEDFFIPGDPSNLYQLIEARSDMAVVRVVETGETFTVSK